MTKQLAKRKIEELVNLYADGVKATYGASVDKKFLVNEFYAQFQSNLLTLEEIENDIKFFLTQEKD